MGWITDAKRVDVAVYAAIARTPTSALDTTMRRLSGAADWSRLNLLAAGVLATAGGAPGRRAARLGLASVAATATAVNVAVKPIARRQRPDRVLHGVPEARHVRMPTSRSLPSGHTASAVAFATGAGYAMPLGALPLGLLAGAVGYSRVHTGVHYPGDVVAGALLGAAIAQATAYALDRR